MSTTLYKRHRLPAEIISHCVWLYHRFDMSFRAVEALLFERGVVLSRPSTLVCYIELGVDAL